MTHDARTDVLVSWLSVNNRAAPLVTALSDPTSLLAGRVGTLYVCWRDARGEDGVKEREALTATLAALRSELDPVCPTIVPMPWKTQASPTDHGQIRPFAQDVLTQVRAEHADAEIFVHVSPGTPAMHAVWLLLGATGFVGGKVTLVQGHDPKTRQPGQKALTRVDFPLETWLQQYRKARPRRAADDDAGHLWDPARVRSPRLREALHALQRAAPLRAPVLLLGERGTGKTTLANFLRSMGPYQKKQPTGWPVVVCGQFRSNPDLARSELFGHAKGGFTGAVRDRVGLLEQADGDTLFLDEIADLDPGTQRLLMAAVEGRGFHRVGDAELRQSSFRLVSATNRTLAELRDGILDPDFLDRVSVFVVEVPPLRECREDLPMVWRDVLRRVASRSGIAPTGWDRFEADTSLLDGLTRHPLPGNIRDVERVAWHLLAAMPEPGSDPQHVAQALRALEAPRTTQGLDDREAMRSALPLRHALTVELDRVRERWCEVALEEAKGNQSRAAELLGVPRKTFVGWLESANGRRKNAE